MVALSVELNVVAHSLRLCGQAPSCAVPWFLLNHASETLLYSLLLLPLKFSSHNIANNLKNPNDLGIGNYIVQYHLDTFKLLVTSFAKSRVITHQEQDVD